LTARKYVDEAGYQTIITIAYWDDPDPP